MAKKQKKVRKVTSKKIIETRPEQLEDQGEFKLKKENVVPEPTPLPKDPEVKSVINPNDPVDTHITEGYKRPSITNVNHVYTKAQFKALVDAYWENFPDMKEKNPTKYEAKKSELDRKLAEYK